MRQLLHSLLAASLLAAVVSSVGNKTVTMLPTRTASETVLPETPAPPTPAPAAGPPTVPMSMELPNVSCPFSRWQGDPRYCYECRWCPFREETCCEMEDEIDVLKSVNVSGSEDWDCFITVVHFQQCGRCDPRSNRYVQRKLLPYVWDIRNVSIRPCRRACQYIYKQCRDAVTLLGQAVVPPGMTEDAFCADSPETSTDAVPCYDAAGALGGLWTVGALLVALLVLLS